MDNRTNKYLIVALLLGILFHGGSIAFTLEGTYDALIHLFFADHYATQWFDPWNESWYTGFTVMGYPPLVHQFMALLSMIGGLKFSLFATAIVCVVIFVTGVYRFSLLITGDRKMAGYASLFAVFSSSFIETLHLFGQLPSIVGISILMHSLPEIYGWIKTKRIKHLLFAWSLIAVTVVSHHVTPIFGMVFFIFPLIGLALMDIAKEKAGSFQTVRFKHFWQVFRSRFKAIIVFGIGSLALIIICILPYWANTKNNPITQVPIPHGSRDNFLEILSSGLVFFAIPWGVLLLFLPYLFYRYFSKRYLFFGLSFSLLALLGTGGTTPIPKIILGENAFNILTLDRFTLWATIMSLPIFGEFLYRFAEGDIKAHIGKLWSPLQHRIIGGVWVTLIIGIAVFTLNLSNFRPSQPAKIDMLPITNFLSQDQHDRWRYLTLGFGDQMAWLSAQTDATSIDGNYHSARRLPELTTRAVERLENSKFRGIEGLGSLQQFLTVPEKYHLKYVFSNDKFYDPLLYFSGWHRLPTLENGISVWERAGVPPLPKNLKRDSTPKFLVLMWGIIPIGTLIITLLIHTRSILRRAFKLKKVNFQPIAEVSPSFNPIRPRHLAISGIWMIAMLSISVYGLYSYYTHNNPFHSPENVIASYYDAMDFKEFEKAYSFLDPETRKSTDDFMLQISVTDGLLGSYAKLDGVVIESLQSTEQEAVVKTTTHWVTPLKKVTHTDTLSVFKRAGKWYLAAKEQPLDIPPDQIITTNENTFYNHGRRRITSEQTYHENIVKQPVIEIISANLIATGSSFAVVGKIQNIDRFPADVAISSTLYDEADNTIAKFSARDITKHRLLPMEYTPFRIDFEDIAWLGNNDKLPATFNPQEFTPSTISQAPAAFGLEIKSNFATSDLYTGVGLQNLALDGSHLTGTLFNWKSQNVTVPQIIVSYFDADLRLKNVSCHYLLESIRPQRGLDFTIDLPLSNETEIVKEGTELGYVNGMPNEESKTKMLPYRLPNEHQNLIATTSDEYAYIQITINNFIGNPR